MPLRKAGPRHHYIPCFYLRRWAVDGFLREFSRRRGKICCRLASPKSTGYQRGLNTIPGLPPELNDQIEKRFFKIADQAASDALDILEGTQNTFTPRERSGWSRFLISLLLRTPEDLAELKCRFSELVNSAGEEEERHYASIRSNGDASTFAEWLQSVPSDLIERRALDVFTSCIDNPQIGQQLNNMHWTVRRFSKPTFELLTSDRPIVRSHQLDQADSHIAIAIGPRRLFIAANESSFIRQIQTADEGPLIKQMNLLAISRAVKFVYGADESQTRFIQNRMSTVAPRLLFGGLMPPAGVN